MILKSIYIYIERERESAWSRDLSPMMTKMERWRVLTPFSMRVLMRSSTFFLILSLSLSLSLCGLFLLMLRVRVNVPLSSSQIAYAQSLFAVSYQGLCEGLRLQMVAGVLNVTTSFQLKIYRIFFALFFFFFLPFFFSYFVVKKKKLSNFFFQKQTHKVKGMQP